MFPSAKSNDLFHMPSFSWASLFISCSALSVLLISVSVPLALRHQHFQCIKDWLAPHRWCPLSLGHLLFPSFQGEHDKAKYRFACLCPLMHSTWRLVDKLCVWHLYMTYIYILIINYRIFVSVMYVMYVCMYVCMYFYYDIFIQFLSG